MRSSTATAARRSCWKSFFARARRGKPSVDHKGGEWISFASMCRGWGQAPECVRSRLKAEPPCSLEAALTSARSPRAGIPVTGPDGTVHRSRRAAGRAYGVSHHAVEARIRSGMADAEAVTKAVRDKRRGQVSDHLGQTWPTLDAMCKAYGISRQTFGYRREVVGLSVKLALTAPTRRSA